MAESIVETTAGKVAGVERGGVHIFRGVPFARPPVGPLRFRPPEPPEPWPGTRPAVRYGPVAPQLPMPLAGLLGEDKLEQHEDCLTLNVWTPAPDAARRPVMVWIHGGAFVNGTGATPWYDGRNFATHGDVVVVTVNYRLGALGFTHLEGLAGGAFAGSGNSGILDQVRALEWVRDNIESFGGDPAQVTVFGESAGAMSVGTLLALPAARGLFRRAILQSGASSFASTPERATDVAARLVKAAGLEESRAAQLAELPVERVLEAQAQVLGRQGGTGLEFQPVVDGTVLPRRPLDAVAAGATPEVDVLAGTTRDEMALFLVLDPSLATLDDSELVTDASVFLGERAVTAVQRYRANRPGGTARDAKVAIWSDAVFRIPAVRLAEAHAARGRSAHMYLFTWATPAFGGALGSCHALEIPFVFDNLHQPGVEMFTGDGEERTGLAAAIHRAWIEFARTGDPGWPRYDPPRRATKVFDGVTNPVEDDPGGDERAVWEGLDWSGARS